MQLKLLILILLLLLNQLQHQQLKSDIEKQSDCQQKKGKSSITNEEAV